jgi:hypothetical protein
MMTDLSGSCPDIIGRVPGIKLRSVESHAAGCGVEKRCHDNAGVGGAIYALVLRQPIDAIRHQPIVGPADEVRRRGKIGGGRDRIEPPDGRKLRQDQAMRRPRRRRKNIRHRNTISVSP